MRVCVPGLLGLLLAMAAPAGAASLFAAAEAHAVLESAAPLDFFDEDSATSGFASAGGGFAPLGSESFLAGGSFARYGLAQASSLSKLVHADVGSGVAEGGGWAGFDDTITFRDPAGAGSFRAAFRLDAAAFRAELGAAGGGGTGATASFRLVVEIGAVAMTWEGTERADAGGGASLRSASLTIGGVAIPGALPDDIVNAGEFVTPEIPYAAGVPLLLRATLSVQSGAEVDPGGSAEAVYAGGLLGGFRWGGLLGLPEDASVESMSGTDWSEPYSVPEPVVALLLAAVVGLLLRGRARRAPAAW